jgi:hypothetical protein
VKATLRAAPVAAAATAMVAACCTVRPLSPDMLLPAVIAAGDPDGRHSRRAWCFPVTVPAQSPCAAEILLAGNLAWYLTGPGNLEASRRGLRNTAASDIEACGTVRRYCLYAMIWTYHGWAAEEATSDRQRASTSSAPTSARIAQARSIHIQVCVRPSRCANPASMG